MRRRKNKKGFNSQTAASQLKRQTKGAIRKTIRSIIMTSTIKKCYQLKYSRKRKLKSKQNKILSKPAFLTIIKTRLIRKSSILSGIELIKNITCNIDLPKRKPVKNIRNPNTLVTPERIF